jgi:DNA-directed RNA polymerase subunit alpha
MKKVSLKDLISPNRVEVEGATADSRYGKFVAEPLERGFGMTIGTAVRRILLSSLQGAAITSIRIDGVSHEFQTMPGVVEDVTELSLNLKEVVLRLDDKRPKFFQLEAKAAAVTLRNRVLTRGEPVRHLYPLSLPKPSSSTPGCL